MAYFQNNNVRIYYEDVGQGEPIIANHGLAEDTTYWSESGVTASLAAKYRVISIDMRGHGRTVVEGEAKGYNEITMGEDFTALADHLKLGRFHLLSHATGGMVAARYGIRHSDRLLSLILTDTGSETLPTMFAADGHEVTEEEQEQLRILGDQLRQDWIKNQPPPPSYLQRKANWRANPGVFTFKMAEHPYSDRMYEIMDDWGQRRNPWALMEFMQSFYTDPDPMVEGLRRIKCPTLLLIGEFDYVFLKPTELMAREIPDNRHVVLRGCGHMTALEAPKWTAHELLDFLECVRKTGRAKW
ncbi:MAG: alpha/beta hydrolase [Deltaproteobacteria bacterium]|nr:alpha/beta hydrolase [Deltaproteobacteria bacterium]